MPVSSASLRSSVGGAGLEHAAADVEHRPPGGGDQPGGLADLLAVRVQRRPVAGQVAASGGQANGGLRLQHVLGDVDQHRAGPAGRGQVERLGDDPRDLRGVGDQEVVLGDRQRDAAGCRPPGRRPCRSARPGTWPVIATIGTESMYASAIGVTRLVAPGPEVAMQTPTLPVACAYPVAACPAPCSWRTRMCRTLSSRRAGRRPAGSRRPGCRTRPRRRAPRASGRATGAPVTRTGVPGRRRRLGSAPGTARGPGVAATGSGRCVGTGHRLLPLVWSVLCSRCSWLSGIKKPPPTDGSYEGRAFDAADFLSVERAGEVRERSAGGTPQTLVRSQYVTSTLRDARPASWTWHDRRR